MSTDSTLEELMAMAGLTDQKPSQTVTEEPKAEEPEVPTASGPYFKVPTEQQTLSVCLMDGTLICPASDAKVVAVAPNGQFNPDISLQVSDLLEIRNLLVRLGDILSQNA